MRRLWAPWRIKYIRSLGKEKGCIFCTKPKEKKDQKNFILKRGKKTFVILNIFPYNPGHLMVAPYRHTGDLGKITEEEAKELFDMLRLSVSALKKAFKPHGFNIGLNIGKTAGAGFPGHLHFHVVPRWDGDTNFMPIIGEVKVIPEEIENTYKVLLPHFDGQNKK
jgi:ATP adenylyltransferase